MVHSLPERRWICLRAMTSGHLLVVLPKWTGQFEGDRLPWAQEVRGSNPRAPTTYFFVFNLLCLTWSASEPELGSIGVQIQAARRFPRRDAALPGSRANKSRA